MTFNFKEYADELLFVPLGGSNEIGMNLNLYAYKGKWLMIDLGIGFADAYLPGVEIVLPNIEFIVKHKKDLLGIVLTHAHEDHLGAVPYLWEELGCPVYATAFTHAVLKAKLADEGISNRIPVTEVKPGKKITLGPFEFEMIPLTHSIPEMQAIALRTDKGVIMHTGDWKLDPDPLVGPVTDEVTLAKYGDEGVLAMVCDSTNVFQDGESGSEAGVRESLTEIIKNCKGRVVVTTFASNIARIDSIVKAAQATGRKIALAGRSLRRVTTAAKESGYLEDAVFLNERDIAEVAKDKILMICTGCQGEPMAALSKIARGEHPNIRLAGGDTVIFSSRKIPGNESRVAHMYNALTRMNIEIITSKRSHVHVSGHPCRDELARMYHLVRPKIAVPTHGEARHIREHAKLARSLQVPETVEARNGSIILLEQGRAKEIGNVPVGYVAVDGGSLIPSDSAIIKVRRKLRDDGCVVVSVVVDERNNELLAAPRISAPGSMDPNEDKELLGMLREEIEETVVRMKPKDGPDKIAEAIRTTMRKVFRAELDKKPVIDVHVIKV